MKTRFIFILLLALIAGITADAQKPGEKITITGEVKDLNKIAVPEAIVMIDDVKTNIHTNQNGFYKVKVKPSAQKIGIVSFAGIAEEAINGRTTIDFNLKGSVLGPETNPVSIPEEEEINVGYINVKERNLTQPVGKINGTNSKYASYNSIYEMIKGEVPGVEVNGTSIRIRGINSLQLSTEPLFVVDGVAGTSIDNITPYMVKSIVILKGSSAAIYGARGSNGVILIDTKK